MTKRNGVLWLVVVVALAVVVYLFRNKVHFDWAMFWQQLRYVSVGISWRGLPDLCDVLAAGGAVGGVCVADEEGLGYVAAGIAVHWIYGSGVVWTAGGSDAAIPGGAASGAVVELAGGGLHDRADVRSGGGGGDLFVRAGVYTEGPTPP